MSETAVNLSQIGRMAGVGRAAVVNWRRRHNDFPAPVGGTETSPTFPRAAAEQWLRDHGRIRQPAPPREPATVTFEGGPTLTVHAPDLRLPALEWSGGEGFEEFGGYIDPDRDGIPWPTATVRIDIPGQSPYAVTDADVDISYAGTKSQYLKLIWPTGRREPLATTPTDAQTTEAH
jgi:hypothetical protein